jgi:hypothetical protein
MHRESGIVMGLIPDSCGENLDTNRLAGKELVMFGEDAALTNRTCPQTMHALHQRADLASEQNAGHVHRGTPALALVYAGEAVVFSEVATGLR